MSIRFVKIKTVDGEWAWINPAFVVAVKMSDYDKNVSFLWEASPDTEPWHLQGCPEAIILALVDGGEVV